MYCTAVLCFEDCCGVMKAFDKILYKYTVQSDNLLTSFSLYTPPPPPHRHTHMHTDAHTPFFSSVTFVLIISQQPP
ncbi:hypothetical protein EXN66_Car019026 [Channa argus]|uniref:Uncharacterized protein n=1 Tax=Channa argus TaxID=215402 RepID=A0A6G1QM71_CHAAH|nr:hypothetical protein EXN66_Car019026 [Channa argus]